MSVVSLKNKYWVLRHGKSIPNERGLVVSSMENGIRSEFQLAPDGVNQAQLAANSFLKELEANNIPLANVRICYSPFSRTTHTANVVATLLNIPFHAPHCKVIQDLRERYFGPSFELLSHDKLELLLCAYMVISLCLRISLLQMKAKDALINPF
ncbi:phosphoglycerate mutase-like protein [Trifolium pratense]|uniref:Phosphoglycerate mutase-like protein n=1 Tax=Trifolium pratense TaxID=57577 RepID=A0A2K3L9S6_TRIPR|nr:phosphoglycerate mutase-like protein [Trifolium pratense]